LVLTNTGSVDLTNVALTSTLPTTGWAVRFDKAKIDSLAAGATADVIAYIQPDGQAVTGDYPATITAKAGDTTTDLDLRVAVQTSTLWGVVAVVIIVVLVGGLYLVFRKFGRR
ncbi:MAG: NEW3 domain-containing protein, partial [Clostridiales bacterium]|nr:NEW3 domain-containing protein [Clostridiales bacterium]